MILRLIFKIKRKDSNRPFPENALSMWFDGIEFDYNRKNYNLYENNDCDVSYGFESDDDNLINPKDDILYCHYDIKGASFFKNVDEDVIALAFDKPLPFTIKDILTAEDKKSGILTNLKLTGLALALSSDEDEINNIDTDELYDVSIVSFQIEDYDKENDEWVIVKYQEETMPKRL